MIALFPLSEMYRKSCELPIVPLNCPKLPRSAEQHCRVFNRLGKGIEVRICHVILSLRRPKGVERPRYP